MTNSQLLLAVILLQQGLFAVGWTVAARLRLAPVAALQWAVGSAALAAGMALVLQRGVLTPWLSVLLANLLGAFGFTALRRGAQRFARLAATDREQAAVLLLLGSGLAAAIALDAGMLPVVVLSAAALGWTMLRGAAEVRRGLGPEFGPLAAGWCAVPMALGGMLFAGRSLLAPWQPAVFATGVEQHSASNTALVFIALAFGMVLNATLISMVVLRLVRRLQYQSDHDQLTGLLGRRPLQRLLRAEAQRQRRHGGSYALLALDIDHFKRINDRHGHSVGDAVLARVARTLREQAREIDSVARIGGEEFSLLLPGVDANGAEAVAQRLLQAMRELHHPELDEGRRPALQPVTISIGLALVSAFGESEQALMRRVDRALYSAKHGGRDRVVRASAPAAAVAAAAELSPA
jgi:diguanylate cyclase (GGDEF)-like protein